MKLEQEFFSARFFNFTNPNLKLMVSILMPDQESLASII
jgi:hypothetical protein